MGVCLTLGAQQARPGYFGSRGLPGKKDICSDAGSEYKKWKQKETLAIAVLQVLIFDMKLLFLY